MKTTGQCPKCQGRKTYQIREVKQTNCDAKGTLRSFDVTAGMAPTGGKTVFGGTELEVVVAGPYETIVCAGCGYAEWYVPRHALDRLERMAEGRAGVRSWSPIRRRRARFAESAQRRREGVDPLRSDGAPDRDSGSQHARGVGAETTAARSPELREQASAGGRERDLEAAARLRARERVAETRLRGAAWKTSHEVATNAPFPEAVRWRDLPGCALRTAIDVVERRVDDELEGREIEREGLGEGDAAIEGVGQRGEGGSEITRRHAMSYQSPSFSSLPRRFTMFL